MESIKRDLNELKNTVQNDTTNMVYSTASMVKNKFNEIGNSVSEIGSLGTITDDEKPEIEKLMKNADDNVSVGADTKDAALPFDLKTINTWTNKFTDTAKSTITLVKDTLVDSIFANFSIDELDDEPYVVKNGQIIKIENWKAKLHKIQIDPNTYCREPSGLLEDFDNWLVNFNLINYQKQTEYLLENVPEIKKYHQDLVPKTITENDFWHRYFYRVNQLKEEQANLIQQKSTSESAHTNDDDEGHKCKQQSQPEKQMSRSSTEEWEQMSNDRNSAKTEPDSKCSSDDDRDWVKCDS